MQIPPYPFGVHKTKLKLLFPLETLNDLIKDVDEEERRMSLTEIKGIEIYSGLLALVLL
jgi:hypothetical protein